MKFLIDESTKIPPSDTVKFNGINSTELYRHGTDDDILIKRARMDELVIITKDIRMALRSIKEGVEVIFIEECGDISFLSAIKHDKSEYPEMYGYLHDKFSCG